MEEQKENKTKQCYCPAIMGSLVIVFAWWHVSWGAIVLSIIGAALILKQVIGHCFCQGKVCKP